MQRIGEKKAKAILGTAAPTSSVGITTISGGKYGVSRFLLKSDEFENAWNFMISVWLKHSGYVWDQREAFERCIGEKRVQGIRHFEADICIPVKPDRH